MPVFAYSIAADPHGPSEGDGFVRAETAQQAVALVGHPEVNVYSLPADAVWPGGPGEAADDISELACPNIGGIFLRAERRLMTRRPTFTRLHLNVAV